MNYRNRARTRGATAALLLAGTMALTGCGSADEPPAPVPLDALVGQSVAQTQARLAGPATMVSYDLSKPVTGAKARYGTGKGAGTDEDWIVVAACGNTKNLEDDTRLAVGVLHQDAYSKDIEHKAKKHAFNRYLKECG
ncbi:hypothetical protein ACFWY6_03375 [Streptomyces sp. NPDC059037]|uniref:hypothetical protein n=1 Tax=Streptomyces sp. NPDC059037 TaxID=3346710 RepID=UPI0036B032F8